VARAAVQFGRTCSRRTVARQIGSARAFASARARGLFRDHSVSFQALRWRGSAALAPSPVWELYVTARDTPIKTSWGARPDVNGDGRDDVIATVPGVSYVYLGGPSGPASKPIVVPGLSVSQSGRYALDVWSAHVASAGDVNGDGHSDVVVATWEAEVSNGAAPLSPKPSPFRSPALATLLPDALASRTGVGERPFGPPR
jgi:hypothetical protein